MTTSHPTDRRTLLKGAVGAGAGLGLAGALGAFRPTPADAAFSPGPTNVIDVTDPTFGAVGTETGTGRALVPRVNFANAVAAAEALSRYTTIYIPSDTTVDLGSGSGDILDGKTCVIEGSGSAGYTFGAHSGPVIQASTATGPVLDFSDWQTPQNFRARIQLIKGVEIRGSGVADPTKARSGIRLKKLTCTTVSDIVIMKTGGPCIEAVASPGDGVYCNTFERITMVAPVGCRANDVPYLTMNEPNSNYFGQLGFVYDQDFTVGTGEAAVADSCGVSGVAVIHGNTSFNPYGNVLDAWWTQTIHVPAGGCIFNFAMNFSTVRDFVNNDSKKLTGASGTTTYRVRKGSVTPGDSSDNFGGNVFRTLVPGTSLGGRSIDSGFELYQGNNVVEGVKGYNQNNVLLKSGVDDSTVRLMSSVNGNHALPGWTIESGAGTNNYLIDHARGVEVRPTDWTIPGAPARVANIVKPIVTLAPAAWSATTLAKTVLEPISIPPKTFKVGDKYVVRSAGTWTNTTGAGSTCLFSLIVNGSVLQNITVPTQATATANDWNITLELIRPIVSTSLVYAFTFDLRRSGATVWAVTYNGATTAHTDLDSTALVPDIQAKLPNASAGNQIDPKLHDSRFL